ncbi:hypothetical protein X798_03728 [Onchocerca flexuosa]|uniref:Uncharacterized protein n=1 Tax=Onchocerca flexuosa TaxID=387005 RepID=A0A238BW17_9BILA|nr:hypothetical protein X798_03728 [Onchocerca flexuosa]
MHFLNSFNDLLFNFDFNLLLFNKSCMLPGELFFIMTELFFSAYNLYNGCVVDNSIKELCYSQEPFRSRYASTDKSLSYACGEGYPSLFTNWHCIQEVALSVICTKCINIVGVAHYNRQKMDNYQILPNSLSTCSSLQTYIHCIRAPIEDRCGRHAYLAVLMTIRRSGETLFPYCTLAAVWYTSSVTLQVISAIISHLFSSTLP